MRSLCIRRLIRMTVCWLLGVNEKIELPCTVAAASPMAAKRGLLGVLHDVEAATDALRVSC
jgi:hypothetical protein